MSKINNQTIRNSNRLKLLLRAGFTIFSHSVGRTGEVVAVTADGWCSLSDLKGRITGATKFSSEVEIRVEMKKKTVRIIDKIA